MSESADFLITLPDHLISEIAEHYFKEELIKIPVKVVDIQHIEGLGIAFALNRVEPRKRDNKGRYLKEVDKDG